VDFVFQLIRDKESLYQQYFFKCHLECTNRKIEMLEVNGTHQFVICVSNFNLLGRNVSIIKRKHSSCFDRVFHLLGTMELDSKKGISGMATKIVRFVPLGLLLVDPSEELGVLREDV
jgi:hypothetical protein